MHISSSYGKILGETNFHAREIFRSGWRAEGVERKKKKKVGEKNGQLRFVRTQARLDQLKRCIIRLVTPQFCVRERSQILMHILIFIVLFSIYSNLENSFYIWHLQVIRNKSESLIFSKQWLSVLHIYVTLQSFISHWKWLSIFSL